MPGAPGSCSVDGDCAMDEICDGGVCIFSGDYQGDGEVLCDLPAVFFGFDSPKLTPETEAKLKAAAECIAAQGRLVYLEAHADARGTEEYNILLTDRRGQGVKKFLSDLGVPAENMQVISKGSLEATGNDEAGYANDRRVQFIWQ
jgi:peptidoglycan-associated lipoprotein